MVSNETWNKWGSYCITNTRCTHKSFTFFFFLKKQIIFKGISFFVHSKISHLLLHTLTIFKVSYEYLARKTFCFAAKHSLDHFHTFKITEVLLVSHWCKEVIDAIRSKDYSRGGRMSHPSDFKVSFASFDVWDRALSCNKNHFSMSLGAFQSFFDQCLIQINHCWR